MSAATWAWQDYAACRGLDLEMFFPAGEQEPPVRAQAACASCPVRADCLEVAFGEHYEGVWGGTTDAERKAMRRAEGRRVRLAAARGEAVA